MARRSGGRPHETDIPPSEPKAPAQARVPSEEQNQIRSEGAESPAAQRTQAASGVDSTQVSDRGGRFRFPRVARIRRRSEIQALYRRGKRRRTVHLDVFVADSPALRTRLALVVPKHGHKIVERNRLKRLLRESARLEFLPLCGDQGAKLDVLLRARPEAYGVAFGQLRTEIAELAKDLCSHASSSS